MTKFLLNIFIWFVFFPYLRIVSIPGTGDTQPFALLFSIFVCIWYVLNHRELRVPKIYIPITFCTLFSVGIFFLNGFEWLRNLVGYLSLCFIGIASYIYLKTNEGISEKFIKSVILIWGFVGFIQAFVYPDFFSFLLPRLSTSETRGVVGLAPEPSYYGTVCLFLMFFSIFHLKSWKYSCILLLQIFLLAKSSIAILLLTVFLIVYLIIKRKFTILSILILLFMSTVGILLNLETSSRAISLLKDALKDDPWLVFRTDASLNDRLSAIYFSIKGFFDHWGLPSLETYAEYVAKVEGKQDFFWEISTGRIMSGYGSALFDLGVVGLIIPVVFWVAIYRFFKPDREMGLIVCISFVLLMLTPVPLALPYLSFFLAYLIHYNGKKDTAN